MTGLSTELSDLRNKLVKELFRDTEGEEDPLSTSSLVLRLRDALGEADGVVEVRAF